MEPVFGTERIALVTGASRGVGQGVAADPDRLALSGAVIPVAEPLRTTM